MLATLGIYADLIITIKVLSKIDSCTLKYIFKGMNIRSVIEITRKIGFSSGGWVVLRRHKTLVNFGGRIFRLGG